MWHKKIEEVIKNMDRGLAELVKIYVKDKFEDGYEEKDLAFLVKLRFSDRVGVVKASSIMFGRVEYFTVREWLRNSIIAAEKEIDNLYKYYGSNISADLMETLEKILQSTYHVMFKTLLEIPEEVSFCQSEVNPFLEYYHLIQELRKIKINDYLGEQ